jgi:hypothetical protein
MLPRMDCSPGFHLTKHGVWKGINMEFERGSLQWWKEFQWDEFFLACKAYKINKLLPLVTGKEETPHRFKKFSHTLCSQQKSIGLYRASLWLLWESNAK